MKTVAPTAKKQNRATTRQCSIRETLPSKRDIAVEKLNRTISRLQNQRDYWKRMARTPDYEAKRKAKWRKKRAVRNVTRAGTTGN
jgi:hypothetical protein